VICCCQRRLRSTGVMLIPPGGKEGISVGNFKT
jgi:hypothetical protein